ncbi:MAG: hypothetical protein GEV06_16540 [Luteitalea sp.]|nr:hypothetical protein [Luteitalea sp.]
MDRQGRFRSRRSTRDRGTYRVTAAFQVAQPAATVWNVLTDYEQIPQFMPEVRRSIVREHSASRALVEQEAVARILLFSKRLHLVLEVHEQGDVIHFCDTAADSFTRYEGLWRVHEHDAGTTVTYELTVQPAFTVPPFLFTRLVKRDAEHMIERLRTEIALRHGGTRARR